MMFTDSETSHPPGDTPLSRLQEVAVNALTSWLKGRNAQRSGTLDGGVSRVERTEQG